VENGYWAFVEADLEVESALKAQNDRGFKDFGGFIGWAMIAMSPAGLDRLSA
jgi:hypothetical protein